MHIIYKAYCSGLREYPENFPWENIEVSIWVLWDHHLFQEILTKGQLTRCGKKTWNFWVSWKQSWNWGYHGAINGEYHYSIHGVYKATNRTGGHLIIVECELCSRIIWVCIDQPRMIMGTASMSHVSCHTILYSIVILFQLDCAHMFFFLAPNFDPVQTDLGSSAKMVGAARLNAKQSLPGNQLTLPWVVRCWLQTVDPCNHKKYKQIRPCMLYFPFVGDFSRRMVVSVRVLLLYSFMLYFCCINTNAISRK